MHIGVLDRVTMQQRWFTGAGCELQSRRSDGVHATDAAVVKLSRRPVTRPRDTDAAESRYLSQCAIQDLPADVEATVAVRLVSCAENCKFKVLAVTSC